MLQCIPFQTNELDGNTVLQLNLLNFYEEAMPNFGIYIVTVSFLYIKPGGFDIQRSVAGQNESNRVNHYCQDTNNK